MTGSNLIEKRVLAIDPTPRGFGFAVMEGPASLLDWGVKSAREDKARRCMYLTSRLIDRYQPHVIVTENYRPTGSRRPPPVQELVQEIRRLGFENGIRTRSFSRFQIRKAFSESGAFTKHEIATAIARRLPEPTLRLPPYREHWMSENYRMNIFDAISLALTFYDRQPKKKGDPLLALGINSTNHAQ